MPSDSKNSLVWNLCKNYWTFTEIIYMSENTPLLVVFVLLSGVTIFLIFSFTFSKGGIFDTVEKEKQIAVLKAQIQKLEKLNAEKRSQLERLKTDEDYRKSIVKGLGVEIGEDEYIFRFSKEGAYDLPQVSRDSVTLGIPAIVLAFFAVQIVFAIFLIARILKDLNQTS